MPRHESQHELPLPVEELSLARSGAYWFLSTAYRHPNEESTARLQELRGLLDLVMPQLADGDPVVAERWTALTATPDTWERSERERGHAVVFGHTPEGPCPPYEGQYGDDAEPLQMPHELSDLGAFYRAFGLAPAGRAHERPDHVAVECEYLSYLCRKQAWAEEHGDATLAGMCHDAQRIFLREHLGRWVPAFARRVLQQAPRGFHRDLAGFTLAFVLDECRRLGVQPGSDHLRLRVATDDRDACFDCPKAAAGCGLGEAGERPFPV